MKTEHDFYEIKGYRWKLSFTDKLKNWIFDFLICTAKKLKNGVKIAKYDFNDQGRKSIYSSTISIKVCHSYDDVFTILYT